MHNSFNTKYAEITIKNGVLFFTYLSIGIFDKYIAKQLVAARLQLQREQAYPILCDIRQLSLPTKQARHYLAVEGSILTKAVAYWVKPHLTDDLMRFFIQVNHPVVPAAMFTEKEEALTYLRKFRDAY